MSALERAIYLSKSGALYAPVSFLVSDYDYLNEICNGCGSANAKFDFIPDRIYGTSIGEACNIHDFMYFDGKSIEDKEEADRVFLNNMYRLIERDKHKWYKPTRWQRIRAKEYYLAVEYFGADAFWKKTKNIV